MVLALLACYRKDTQRILGIEDPDAGILAIAWVGSLGALTANFIDIARRADRWNPHLAIWFAVRPLTGAAFGAVGYLIYRAAVQASVTNEEPGSKPAILGYAIAFTLGYREEMFRELLKRITDRISFVDRSVEDSEPHQYSVTAFDNAGNESAPAGPVWVHGPRDEGSADGLPRLVRGLARLLGHRGRD